MSWPIAKLGDHIQVLSGFAFNSKKFSDSEGVPLIRIRDIVRGFTETYYNGEFDHKYLIKKGDLLVGMDGQFNAVRWRSGKALLNQRVCKIESLEKLDERYLSHLLPNKLKEIEDKTAFVTVKHLSVKKIKEIEFPLPPLNDQKRIAAILDKAEEIRQCTKDVEIIRENLLQSHFIDLFGDPAINQMEWSTTGISDLIEIQGGFAFKSQDYVNKGVRLLKISNVHFLNANWDKVDYLPREYLEKYQQFSLNENDIVIALTRPIIQSLNNVKVIKISNTDLPCLLNQRVARFVINKEIINPYFLFFFLLTPYFKNKIVEYCSTSLQPNVSTKQIGEIPIFLPPIKLQNQFADFVMGVEKLPLVTMLAEEAVNSVIQDIL